MTREIKFRLIRKEGNPLVHYLDLDDLIGGQVTLFVNDYYVSEYTGLKDKNGVDIYESDIVKDSLGLEIEIKNLEYYSTSEQNLVALVDNGCEVVGNLYENKRK